MPATGACQVVVSVGCDSPVAVWRSRPWAAPTDRGYGVWAAGGWRSYNVRMNTIYRRGHLALRRGRFSAPGHVYHVTAATHERMPLLGVRADAATAGRVW